MKIKKTLFIQNFLLFISRMKLMKVKKNIGKLLEIKN